jgi:internalin A
MMQESRLIKIYFSYVNTDRRQLFRIIETLPFISSTYNVEFLYPDEIVYNESVDIANERNRVPQADIYITVLSTSYLANMTGDDGELAQIKAWAQKTNARIMTLLLEDCNWQSLQLKSLPGLPLNNKSLLSFGDVKEPVSQIVTAVSSVIEVLSNERATRAIDECINNTEDITLDLSGMGLQYIPFELLHLGKLQVLNLNNNQIKQIQHLDALVQLQRLELSENQLTQIENLQALTNLQRLTLCNNDITEIKNLEALQQLSYLDLWKNEITQIKGLEHAKQLIMLGLSENKIEVIEGISHLTKLKKIYIAHNQIKDISPLAAIPSLERIVCTNNKINSLKPLLKKIKKELDVFLRYSFNEEEGGLFVKDNPLSDPPEEVVLHGRHAIIKHFADTEVENEKLEILKFIIVGNSKVGKTNFCEFLNAKPITVNGTSTHILDIQKLKADFLKSENGTEMELRLFDFGGQDYYHDNHRMYYSHDTAYILLWDTESNKYAEKEETITGANDTILYDNYPLAYWLESINYNLKGKYLETYAKGSNARQGNKEKLPPVLIIQNKIDIANGLLNQEELSARYPNIWGYYGVSLLLKKRTEVLKELLSDYLTELNLSGRVLAPYQKKIVDYYAENNNEELKIYSLSEFKQRCIEIINDPTVVFEDNDASVMAHILNNTGIIFLDTTTETAPVVYTNISLLNREVKRVMDIARKGNEKGVFSVHELDDYDDIQNKEKILELLTANKSIIKLNSNQYLAPQFLPTEPDPSVKFFLDTFTHTHLRYVYSAYFHKSLLLNLFARYINPSGQEQFYNLKNNPYWRNGLIITRGEGAYVEKVLVEFIKGEKKGTIHIRTMKPFSRNGLEREIETVIDELNRGWTVDKEVSADSKTFFKADDLKSKSLQKEFEFYEQGKKFRINDFKNIIQFEKRPARFFISYSSLDKSYLQDFTRQLISLRTEGLVETWDDRELQAGDKWDAVIKEQLEKADYIVLLISSNFLNSEYIRDVELKEALENSAKRVIPVMIDYCSWQFEDRLKEIQVLNKNTPLTSYQPVSKGWLEVVNGIRSVLTK